MSNAEGESLRNYLRINKITQADLAMKTGVSRGTILNYLNLPKLPDDFKQMLKTEGIDWANVQDKGQPKYNEGVLLDMGNTIIMQVPLVTPYAYAGYLKGYGDAVFMDTLPRIPFVVEKEHKGTYIAIEVSGESMDNGSREGYRAGDILLLREVPQHHWQNKLHIKKWDFVIATKEDGILVKQITKHDPPTGAITLHSLNPDYEDIEMNLSQVSKIFNVVQVSYKKTKG